MSKRPMYLQHVNIYVRNAERSKEWYEEMLGLHTYEYRPGWRRSCRLTPSSHMRWH